MVNGSGQVTNIHPLTDKLKPETPKTHENIFSFGDVCITPHDEIKGLVSMFEYIHTITGNMFTVANGT